MIGNDIVDLIQSREESDWRRRGWTAKTLTPDECLLTERAAAPDLVLWLLWSMKEAAYKIVNRETGRHFFAPRQLACYLSEYNTQSASGYVSYAGKKYFTRTLSGPGFIHTIACAATVDPAVLQSEIRQVSVASRVLKGKVLLKEAGFPFLQDCRSGLRSIASRSHHGRFDAIVFIA